jgi:hypothetical protein
MKKLHRIAAKHKKFSTIPVHTFYFDNNKDLIEASKLLFEENFNLKFNLRMKMLTIRELKSVYLHNPLIIDEDQLSYKTKEEITKQYEKNYGS